MLDEHSPQTTGLTRMQPPTPSRTTGAQPVAERLPSSTGTLPSALGVDATTLGRWVAQQLGPFHLPEVAMRTLTSSLSSHLEHQAASVMGTDGQFDHVKVRFGMKPGMPRAAAQRDLSVLESVCAAAPATEVVKHIAILKARTKSAGQDQGEARFGAEVMVGDLAAYPIDVVEYACNYWIAGGKDAKWFPAWPELREICERRMQPRRALRKALQWVVDGEPLNAA